MSTILSTRTRDDSEGSTLSQPPDLLAAQVSGMIGYIKESLQNLELEDEDEATSAAAISASIHLLESLKALLNQNYPYPHVTGGDDGDIFYEWRSREKNVVLYVSRTGATRMQQVPARGPCSPWVVNPDGDDIAKALEWYQAG